MGPSGAALALEVGSRSSRGERHVWPAQQDHVLLWAGGRAGSVPQTVPGTFSRMQLRPHLAQTFLPPLPQLPVTCPWGLLFPPRSEPLPLRAVISSSRASLPRPHDWATQRQGIVSYNHSLDKHLMNTYYVPHAMPGQGEDGGLCS